MIIRALLLNNYILLLGVRDLFIMQLVHDVKFLFSFTNFILKIDYKIKQTGMGTTISDFTLKYLTVA